MPLSIFLTIICVLMASTFATAMPLSYYSCDIAEEKLVKAQRALKAVQEELRTAKRQEQYARAELWTCVPGGKFSLVRTRRCGHARDYLPTIMKQTIDATYRVEEHQQTVADRHAWQMTVCENTP